MCHKLCYFMVSWFHRPKYFEAMKAGKSAIWPWLSCQYNENTLVDLPSSVLASVTKVCTYPFNHFGLLFRADNLQSGKVLALEIDTGSNPF